ncbi:MAG TPA: response regulator transcription factor [Actinocrinis sp.]|jgi:DNA-binding NarL/FixJ family response regulator
MPYIVPISGRRPLPPRRPSETGSDLSAQAWPGTHLLVADSAPIVYAGVAAIAAGTDWISAVTYAGTGREAIESARTAHPNLVLLGLRLPDMFAPEILRGLRIRAPQAKVVIFTSQRSHSVLEVLIESGVEGVVNKHTDPTDLLEILGRVERGERFIDEAEVAPTGPRDRGVYGLTRREYEILRRIALGETNAEIARVLGLSANTVKTYIQRALQKLGARNRVEALNVAGRIGLL